MNAQQLEYVRIQLRAALADDSGGTKGQLEAFAEHPPADKNLHPRKHVHVVELDNGRGGIRSVKAENTALYVLETRSRRRPMPPIRDIAFSSCAWRRAVLKLDISQQAWIRYCYGFDLNFSFQTEICSFIWDEYCKQFGDDKLQKRVIKRLVSLVWLAAQDVAAKNSNATYKEYAATALASMMSIERRAWYKTYAQPWREMKTIAGGLDLEAINEVGKQLNTTHEHEGY
ncbi:bacteriophage antitermination protein Q [Kosakonia sacchari]|uniref:bacteriophage antitermination protein Q n=1 Tax=Kosakonia sacchari TaxID=1158459 RepID=UPI002ACDD22F|nr:bacteriophage antitermination protein Q [Kosakonia sacchari]MDZ7320727.1 bacteriophage antitermination protein Q [Kosakonia sacchari]